MSRLFKRLAARSGRVLPSKRHPDRIGWSRKPSPSGETPTIGIVRAQGVVVGVIRRIVVVKENSGVL